MSIVGQLPGGYRDGDGRLHREFELTALTGREEELLAEAGRVETASLVTEVLSRCVRRLGGIAPVPVDLARRLLVGDRQFLLLRLRQATFGDQVLAHLTCPWPDCGQRVTLRFSLGDVPVRVQEEPAPEYTVALPDAGEEAVFRLPDGGDQEAVSPWLARNEGAALTLLLARCVRRIGVAEEPGPDRVAALSSVDRSVIEERMAAAAPAVDQTMEAACAECGRAFLAPFDVASFLLGELRDDGERLYQEIHYLAYHYHWSEAEIAAMTREKRRRYIDILADTIEGLNRVA